MKNSILPFRIRQCFRPLGFAWLFVFVLGLWLSKPAWGTNVDGAPPGCSSCYGCDCEVSEGGDEDSVEEEVGEDNNEEDGDDGDPSNDADGTSPATGTQQTGEQAPNNAATDFNIGGKDVYPASFSHAAAGRPELSSSATKGGDSALYVRYYLGDVAEPKPADQKTFYYASGPNGLEKNLPTSWKANESSFNKATTSGLVPAYATMRASRAHPNIFERSMLKWNHALYMNVEEVSSVASKFETKQYRVEIEDLPEPQEGFTLTYYQKAKVHSAATLLTTPVKTVTIKNPTPNEYRFVDIHSVWMDGSSNFQERYIRYDLPTAFGQTPPSIGKLDAGTSVVKTVFFSVPTTGTDLTAVGDGPRVTVTFHPTIDGAFIKTTTNPTLNTDSPGTITHFEASKELKRYRPFGDLKRLVAHTVGYDTDQPLTTRYGYFETPHLTDTNGRLHFVLRPDGYWRVHKYSRSSESVDDLGNLLENLGPLQGGNGQIQVDESPSAVTTLTETIYEPIGNQPFTTALAPDQNGNAGPEYRVRKLISTSPEKITETVQIGSQEISREVRVFDIGTTPSTGNNDQGGPEVRFDNLAFPNQNMGEPTQEVSLYRIQGILNERGRTYIATITSLAGYQNAGRVAWKKLPDGTAEVYGYENDYGGVDGQYLVTKRMGSYDTSIDANEKPQILEGSQSETLRSASGVIQKVSLFDFDINNGGLGILLSDWEATDFDSKGRPTEIIENSDVSHRRFREYGCCGLLSETAPNGIKTETTKDRMKRTSRVRTTAGNRVQDVYYKIYGGTSSSGHPTIITEVSRSGHLASAPSSEVEIAVSKTVRHLNGLVLERWTADENNDSLMERTTIATEFGLNGFGKTVTTTDSLNGTRKVISFADGRTQSVTGTAVADMKYVYGVAADGESTRTIRLSYDTAGSEIETEWTERVHDGIGRTQHLSYSGTTAQTVYSYFHSLSGPAGSRGKLESMTDPDGVEVSYGYNSEGERETSSRLIPGQTDSQVTKTISEAIVFDTGNGMVNGIETTSIVFGAGDYDPTDDSAGIVTSQSFRSGDGFFSRSESFGRVSSSEMIYLSTAGSWVQKSYSPTSYTEQNYVDGVLDEVLLKDSNSATTSVTSTSYDYDLLNRVTGVTDQRTGLVNYGPYTASGNLLGMDDHTRVTTYQYDSLGRRIQTDSPNTDHDNITHTSYYPTGQVKATWGDNAYPRFYQYDEQNRMVKLHTWQTAPTLDQTTVAAPTGSTQTTWIYNLNRGWLDEKQDADGKGASYLYTDAGRLQKRTWERGVVTDYLYEEGVLTDVNYSGEANGHSTPDLEYSYTKFGQLNSVERGGQLHSDYAYDPNNLLLTSENLLLDTLGNGGKVLNRNYQDGTGTNSVNLRPSGYTVGSGTADFGASYGYDSLGRLQHVHSAFPLPVDPATSDFEYGYEDNTFGLIESITGPAHQVTNDWQADRNVLHSKSNDPLGAGTTAISSYTYEVNSLGQRTKVTHGGSEFGAASTVDWDYDALGQVTEAEHSDSNQSQSYSYDTIGNRTMTGYTANNLNQYDTVPSTSATVGPDYDDDGNATDYPLPAALGANAQLTWDAENRLVKVEMPDASIINYEYDYLGRRILRSEGATPTTETHYLYNGWNCIAEYTGSTLDRTYLWGVDLSGSMQGAGGVGGLLSQTEVSGGAATYYPTYDGNGNVSEYLTSTGSVSAHYEYDSFGNLLSTSNDSLGVAAYKFSTKPQDAMTGLYYYGYRYYDPVTGRWPSRDPIAERGGLNTYCFLDNDNVNDYDILGLLAHYKSKVVSKSFIDGIPDVYNRTHTHPDWLNLELAALAFVKLNAFNQRPTSDAKDTLYRLFAQMNVSFCCDKGKLLKEKLTTDMDGGVEEKLYIIPWLRKGPYAPIKGTINLNANLNRISDSTVRLVWGAWGRPNKLAEPVMQKIGKRTSKNIWHGGAVDFVCSGDSGHVSVVGFKGSRFPSHRLYVDGPLFIRHISQDFLSDLWQPHPSNPNFAH